MNILYLIIGFASGLVLGLMRDEDKSTCANNDRVIYQLIRLLHSLKEEDDLNEKTTRIMAKCDAALDEYLKNK